MLEMERGNLQAPRIGQGMAGLLAQCEKCGVRQGDHSLIEWLAPGGNCKFHVHRIGMTDRNPGLQPVEVDLPHAPERIGAGFEFAVVIEHPINCSLSRTDGSCGPPEIETRREFPCAPEKLRAWRWSPFPTAAFPRRASSCRSGALH